MKREEVLELLKKNEITGEGYIRVISVGYEIANWMNILSIVILIACGLMATVFAVYIGFKMATAEDDKKRTEAKQQLVYSIVGMVIIVLLASVIYGAVPKIEKNMEVVPKGKDGKIDPNFPKEEFYCAVAITNCILSILRNCAFLFALYIGWQLMKAEDEAKRKDAKMQVLYTLAAVLVVIFLQAICMSTFTGLKVPE